MPRRHRLAAASWDWSTSKKAVPVPSGTRLEDADYEGRSLSVLERIARALNQKLTGVMTAREADGTDLREAFPRVVQMLRRSRGLTIDELSNETGIDRSELMALERNPGYRPSPLTLHRLGQFFELPDRKLAVLTGAIREVPEDLRQEAVKFAAQSDSFSKLTREEQRALDDFVAFLRSEK